MDSYTSTDYSYSPPPPQPLAKFNTLDSYSPVTTIPVDSYEPRPVSVPLTPPVITKVENSACCSCVIL